MKVQDPKRVHPPFDIPAGAWQFYKSQGYTNADEVVTEPLVTVTWRVQKGRFIGDYEAPPLITYSTSNGLKGYCESQHGTAHKSIKVYIPGQRPETCPSHVGEEYTKLFAEWAAKSKRRKPSVVEHVSPNAGGKPSWAGVATSPWAAALEYREKNK